ncbi:MAG: dihydroneopterin aldolase [Burkholderiales bacterium]|jgi:dihydroneopterin aldolase|nr:dihydroneopterin aldolase [Pseudomonadota bacterium]MDA1011098.1 dihydroneopterin aldolase [Pseudomonadota bacterium]|tara:strand:+ start:39754 stop:40128 length:375 start_codon:yes stop_codon:yes gene_type:complete
MNPESKPHRKIFLKDMSVSLSIGIHDFEKLKKQNVLINVELDLDPNLRILEDTITETVNYDFLRTSIINLSTNAHFHLQETFCEKILELCLDHEGVLAARVSSEKTDVYPDCTSVGFEIFQAKA